MMEEVVDKAGRRIKLRRVGVLETLRLFKALGPELSENNAYITVAATAASVSEIDGVPVPFPVSEGAVEALISRIGDETLVMLSIATKQKPNEEIVADAGN
jgi:hypothetical protein